MRQWVEWPAWRWVVLALAVWVARAVVVAAGNDDAGPLLAAVAAVLLAVGVVRAVTGWLAGSSSPVARRDDE